MPRLLLEIDVRDLELVDGTVQPKGTPERGLTLAEIGESLDGFSSAFEPLEGHGGTVPPVLAPLTSAHLVHVRVDRESGEVAVLDYVIAQDVGRALNPAIIEGQLHGGATQGLGWALHEAMVYDEAGQLLTGTFLDYAMPTAPMVPDVRDDHRRGPGARRPVRREGDRRGSGLWRGGGGRERGDGARPGSASRTLPMTGQRIWRGLQPADGADPPGRPSAGATGRRARSR